MAGRLRQLVAATDGGSHNVSCVMMLDGSYFEAMMAVAVLVCVEKR